MKIKLDRRNRGIGAIPCLIILALFLVFVGSLFYIILKACHRIDPSHSGGVSELTNNLSYDGPGVVVFQMHSIISVPTNQLVAEEILYTDNLCSPWQPLTNIVLQDDQVFDWTALIDKTKPCGFFKITLYGTNQ